MGDIYQRGTLFWRIGKEKRIEIWRISQKRSIFMNREYKTESAANQEIIMKGFLKIEKGRKEVLAVVFEGCS